jgi:hypothetical protein
MIPVDTFFFEKKNVSKKTNTRSPSEFDLKSRQRALDLEQEVQRLKQETTRQNEQITNEREKAQQKQVEIDNVKAQVQH